MTAQLPATTVETFYLIVTDHDRGVFAVEGPMTDDKHWHDAAREARNHTNTASPAARPGQTATCWQPSIGASTSSLACRRAAL
jgi:hypothetical protein